MAKYVRPMMVAGSFYPADKNELIKQLNRFFGNVKQQKFVDVHALLAPHAGYVYSGQTAAHGFKQLDKNYEKVFILASNHSPYAIYHGASVPAYTHYKTPLGEVKVSSIAEKLLDNDIFVTVEEAHQTHVEEVELPFLQMVLKNFEIIPIITSDLTVEECDEISRIIGEYLDEKTLIVISSDMSHFHSYDEAVKLDNHSIETILNLDLENLRKCEIDGIDVISILIRIAKDRKWSTKLLHCCNSGDVTGNKSEVVGYSSIVFCEK